MRQFLLLSGLLAGGLRSVYAEEEIFNPLTYVDTLIGTANEGNGIISKSEFSVPRLTTFQCLPVLLCPTV